MVSAADALAKFRAKPQVIESSDHLWCLHVSEFGTAANPVGVDQKLSMGEFSLLNQGCPLMTLILDCFEGIAKDVAGESHHFSLDQIYNDLDRCLFVWWNLKIGTFIFLVVVRREPICLSRI